MKDLWLRLRNHPGLVMFFLILPYILLRAPWFQGTSLSVVGVMIVLLFAFMFITTPREKLDAALESNKLKDEVIAERNRMLGKWLVLFKLLMMKEVAHDRLLELGLEVHQAEDAEFKQALGLEVFNSTEESYPLAEKHWQELKQAAAEKWQELQTCFDFLRAWHGVSWLRYEAAALYVRAHDRPEKSAVAAPTAQNLVDLTGDPNLRRGQRHATGTASLEQESADILGGIAGFASETVSGPNLPSPEQHAALDASAKVRRGSVLDLHHD